MKSLERLKHIENAPEFMGGDERYKRSINSPIRYIEDITAIKQDLEVLEIIKKKRVDMKLFAMFCVALTNEEILFSYNSNCSYEDEKLTKEELLKLKQWLEGNEE